MERFLFLGAVTAVLVVASVASVPSGAGSWIAVAAGVAAFGLPHGALDTRMARVTFGLEDARGVAGFVVVYVALAAIVAAFWIVAPVAALCAFLAYAALHFGQDWTERPAVALLFGAALLSLPALRFEAEVAAIFQAMTGAGQSVASVMHFLAPAAGVSALLVAARHHGAALEIGAYGALALVAPPHITFAIYFCALHSPRHFRETAEGLGLTTRQAVGAALPWAAPVAVAGAATAAWLASAGAGALGALAPVIFTGLACLTVPHMTLEMIVERPRWRNAVARATGLAAASATSRANAAGASRW